MKFGKLEDISQVDFSLPNDPKLTEEKLEELQKKSTQNNSFQIYYGATGWGMKEWVGTYYPTGTSAPQYLQEYTKQFSSIELNTTHYRIPSEKQIKDWYTKSSSTFKFAPKLPQMISHSKDLGMSTDRLAQFCEVILGLKEKLGICFMQLPPYFNPTQLDVLDQFLIRYPTESIPLAIEFRQEAWFGFEEHTKALFQLLEYYNVTPVITDVAGRRDVLHMLLTNDSVVVRFVGNGLVPSDYERVDQWCIRLKKWVESGVTQVYFLLHQPDNLRTPEITSYFVHKINQTLNLSLKAPQKYEDQQMTLF
ncbi:MAG: DUF72 domain-containing protein [Saprospiraceae bacterium]|nr:DUF72 domain-containing protein [Saprospiraceae bacterium]